ncbi:hypothetical protein [Moraxella catarrhalis]|uniref:hypothetical protein n=1 Tax=Moraxella catarrhalis TaxID=480 RepID=UPI0007E3F3B6|nr:hypothetical protein [Moraxella catarrhalis]OAV14229.1 hypothetical protein AO375_1344 [Moraxella catarrhalis]OAV16403.1 hypothetical protein AO374_1890 [Moraxella catarrhalis]
MKNPKKGQKISIQFHKKIYQDNSTPKMHKDKIFFAIFSIFINIINNSGWSLGIGKANMLLGWLVLILINKQFNQQANGISGMKARLYLIICNNLQMFG